MKSKLSVTSIIFVVFLLTAVMATVVTSFNDITLPYNITFNGSENHTINLTIPRDSFVNSALLNITGVNVSLGAPNIDCTGGGATTNFGCEENGPGANCWFAQKFTTRDHFENLEVSSIYWNSWLSQLSDINYTVTINTGCSVTGSGDDAYSLSGCSQVTNCNGDLDIPTGSSSSLPVTGMTNCVLAPNTTYWIATSVSSTGRIFADVLNTACNDYSTPHSSAYNDGESSYHYKIKIDFVEDYTYPLNSWLEIGNLDGFFEWNYSGNYSIEETTNDLSYNISTALNNTECNCDGCTSAYESCYQEKSDSVNLCYGGTTPSGSFAYEGVFIDGHGPEKLNDGNWDTYSDVYYPNSMTFYINYSKPDGADATGSKWIAKTGGDAGTRRIYTIPSGCWAQEPLQFRMIGIDLGRVNEGGCWNGTTWQQLFYKASPTSSERQRLWEEAMNWSIPGNNCSIPFTFHSDGEGILELSELNIVYNDRLSVNSCEPTHLTYSNNTNLVCNITDDDGDTILWSNFTLTDPYGTTIISGINGTQSGDLWSSSATTFYNGTYYAYVDTIDSVNPNIRFNPWYITVYDGNAYFTPSAISKSIAQASSATQNVTITPEAKFSFFYNVTTNHDQNNLSVVINNNRSTSIDSSPMESEFIITADSAATPGIYYFNATWTREDSQADTWIVPFSVTIDSSAAIIAFVNGSGISSVHAKTTADTFNLPIIELNNTGNWNASNCSMYMTPDVGYPDVNSYISWNETGFKIEQGVPKTVTGTASVTSALSSEGYFSFTCTNTTPGGGSSTEHAITSFYDWVITTYTPPTPPVPSGGGGAVIQTTNITTVVKAVCGDDVCDEDESYLSCPADCGVEKLPAIVYAMGAILAGIFVYQFFVAKNADKKKKRGGLFG